MFSCVAIAFESFIVSAKRLVSSRKQRAESEPLNRNTQLEAGN